jgi:hypothetical protein
MPKFDIKKTKDLKFARFGGLSSVNQEGYRNKNRGFHTPPASRGFYSFVWPIYEKFLLGGSWTAWPWKLGSKFKYVRDENGQLVTEQHPQYEKFSQSTKVFSVPTKNWNKNQDSVIDWFEMNDKTEEEVRASDEAAKLDWETNHKDEPKWLLAQMPKPKIFVHRGPLWHHLGEYIKPHQIIAQKGSWSKSSIEDYRCALEKIMHECRRNAMGEFSGGFKVKDPMLFLPSAKNPFYFSGKDHLEVFIEKV